MSSGLENIIDFENNKLRYKNKIISIIICDNDIFFKAKDVAIFLEYENTIEAIKNYVDEEDIITLQELKELRPNNDFPLNIKSCTKYINESGIYSLVFSSKIRESGEDPSKAKTFFKWITNEIIPSLHSSLRNIQNNQELEELKLENKKLKNLEENVIAKKEKYIEKHFLKQTEIIYIATSSYYLKQNIFKVGGTININSRISSYNTGRTLEDKMFIIKEYNCLNYDTIEWIIYRILRKHAVDGVKELYQLPLQVLDDLVTEIIEQNKKSIETYNNFLDKIFDNINVCDDNLKLDDIEDKYMYQSKKPYIKPSYLSGPGYRRF